MNLCYFDRGNSTGVSGLERPKDKEIISLESEEKMETKEEKRYEIKLCTGMSRVRFWNSTLLYAHLDRSFMFSLLISLRLVGGGKRTDKIGCNKN